MPPNALEWTGKHRGRARGAQENVRLRAEDPFAKVEVAERFMERPMRRVSNLWSNPSIERTPKSQLRCLLVAAHVKR